MTNPKTATRRSPAPPAELRDELHFVDGLLHWVTPSGRRKYGPIGSPTASSTGKAYSRCGRDKAKLLAWLTAKREELHGEYHHH